MRAFKQLIFFSLISTLAFGQLFINEIDYDQPSTDNAEFVEIAGPAGTYSNITLELFNGNDGSTYDPSPITIPSITLTDESNGYGFYVVGVGGDLIPIPSGWTLQNGAPDGVVLKIDGVIVDAVSYEGEMAGMENAGEDIAIADQVMSLSRLGLDGSPWEPLTPTQISHQ